MHDTKISTEQTVEVWFQIESSTKEENDWVTHGAQTYDNVDTPKRKLQKLRDLHRCYDFQLVRKTLTTEVVADA